MPRVISSLTYHHGYIFSEPSCRWWEVEATLMDNFYVVQEDAWPVSEGAD